jgi:hypothetical protein
VPTMSPEEFERDVVRVARWDDLTHAVATAGFAICVESVRRWCRKADVDDDVDVVNGQTRQRAGRSRCAAPQDPPPGAGERVAPTPRRCRSQPDVTAGRLTWPPRTSRFG